MVGKNKITGNRQNKDISCAKSEVLNADIPPSVGETNIEDDQVIISIIRLDHRHSVPESLIHESIAVDVVLSHRL